METGVMVVGSGQVKAPADVLRMTLSVGHDAQNVAEAVAQVAERTDTVVAALRGQGVGEGEIETSAVSVYPQYADSMSVAAYRASHSLTVTTKDLTGFGRLLDAAVAAAGNTLGLDHLQFDIEDKTALLVRARELAFQQAREKADQLAALAGYALGSVVTMSETYSHTPMVESAGLAAKAAFDQPLSIAPGDQSLEVSLQVHWSWS